MAIRTIRTDPDPCLYKKCRAVEQFDARLATLIDDMFETMYHADGVGLAGPQVGVLRRVVVIDTGENPVELVNPEIVETSGAQGAFEGCLSFPGKSGYVERPNYVTVTGFDRHGKPVRYQAEGLFARAVLHENDHLDGLVYTRLVTDPPEGYGEDDDEEEEG